MTDPFTSTLQSLLIDALEIAKDDNDFRNTDEKGFFDVMWSDDDGLIASGLSDSDYRDAVSTAYEIFAASVK